VERLAEMVVVAPEEQQALPVVILEQAVPVVMVVKAEKVAMVAMVHQALVSR
jgi:hypothetical protein